MTSIVMKERIKEINMSKLKIQSNHVSNVSNELSFLFPDNGKIATFAFTKDDFNDILKFFNKQIATLTLVDNDKVAMIYFYNIKDGKIQYNVRDLEDCYFNSYCSMTDLEAIDFKNELQRYLKDDLN